MATSKRKSKRKGRGTPQDRKRLKEKQSQSPLAPNYSHTMTGGGNGLVSQSMERRPTTEIAKHWQRSFVNQKRVPPKYLRAFANALPIYGAMLRIKNGASNVKWSIEGPKDDESEAAAVKAERIHASLATPNVEKDDSYTLLQNAIIDDYLTLGVAAIERIPAMDGDPDREFWLWAINPENIRLNPEWTPYQEGLVPRYFDTQGFARQEYWRPLKNKDLFLIRSGNRTSEFIPPSALEICFNLVVSWLGLSEFQHKTTSNAGGEYVIDIGPCTEDELDKFKQLFRETTGTLIFGRTESEDASPGVDIQKAGARRDDELYLKYEEKLMRLFALAFQLSTRDLNITTDDSYATADVAAQQSFQYAVLPIVTKWFERINKDVIQFYCPGYEAVPADLEPRNEQAEADTAYTLYSGEIITLNEARRRTGEDNLGDRGEIFYDDSGTDKGEETTKEGVTSPDNEPNQTAKPKPKEDSETSPEEDPKAADSKKRSKRKRSR